MKNLMRYFTLIYQKFFGCFLWALLNEYACFHSILVTVQVFPCIM